MVFYIVSPYVFPPKHHSSTNDSNRESGVQVAVAITSPQVLNTCPCRRGWGEMKPRKYTIWEHPTINWWFLKSSSLFVLRSASPPKKKKKRDDDWRPSLPLQCKKSPILESATLAKPLLVIGMAGFFSEMVLRGGKVVLPTFHKRRTMKTEVRLAKLSGLLGWTEEKKKRWKNLEPHWPSGNFGITSDACSKFQCAQHPATTTWKLILDLQLKSVAFCLEKVILPSDPFILGEANAIAWEVVDRYMDPKSCCWGDIMYVCIYVYIYMCVFIFIYLFIYSFIYTCMILNVCMYSYMVSIYVGKHPEFIAKA